MDSDLSAALESVLSDPGKMEKVAAMAKDLFGQTGPRSETAQTDESGSASAAPASAGGPPAGDTALLSALSKAFASGAGKSRSTALLMAMRPYMKPEKQAKLDKAMQIARMASIAGVVMKEYGGGGHGL